MKQLEKSSYKNNLVTFHFLYSKNHSNHVSLEIDVQSSRQLKLRVHVHVCMFTYLGSNVGLDVMGEREGSFVGMDVVGIALGTHDGRFVGSDIDG